MSSNTRDELPQSTRLRITEIFYSIQGESRPSGCPTVFVRLTGCPLRCGYCDTEYAFHGGDWLGFEDILQEVAGYSPEYVCVTGGEPGRSRTIVLFCRHCVMPVITFRWKRVARWI